MFLGYTRVSTGMVKEAAEERMQAAGCDCVYTQPTHPAFRGWDEWEDLCRDIRPGDTLVLNRKEDIPDILDFDTLVIVLAMIGNSAVMLIDDDGNLHRVMPKAYYGRTGIFD